METYDVSELVKDVKIILDRNQESASLLPLNTDTLTQSELIESKLCDAARIIAEQAPEDMLGDISSGTLNVTWTNYANVNTGTVTLNKDVLRLLCVTANKWQRQAKLITSEDEEYKQQQNRFIRGSDAKPVAAVVHRNGSRVLELYSTKYAKDIVVQMEYVERPKIENGKIKLCSDIKKAIEYLAASLTCISLGDNATASNLQTIAYRLAGIQEQVNQ